MPNAPLRTTGTSTRQAQYHADRILFVHALGWMCDRYGTGWEKVGTLPAGVQDARSTRADVRVGTQALEGRIARYGAIWRAE